MRHPSALPSKWLVKPWVQGSPWYVHPLRVLRSFVILDKSEGKILAGQQPIVRGTCLTGRVQLEFRQHTR